jgi:hypothetical protein
LFPTPKQRYEVYVAWCRLLGVQPLSESGWRWQLERIPERQPIAWSQHTSLS